ncbi:hypothetical protein JYT83_01015 [bacterium AH-315-F18]|nr:hypothetical protein [bacterium AH-315-F18]
MPKLVLALVLLPQLLGGCSTPVAKDPWKTDSFLGGLTVYEHALVRIENSKNASNGSPHAKQSTEELIDQLVRVRVPKVGFHGFLPIDGMAENPSEADNRLHKLGSSILLSLITRGQAALPSLLKHLSDDRKNRLVIESPGGGTIIFSDEYLKRATVNKKRPTRLVTSCRLETNSSGKSYTIKVGDVCYFVIGQIVNRPLDAASWAMSRCIVINSPIKRPNLVGLTRRDWKGLTAEEHEELLLTEATEGNEEALVRLWFYYPKHRSSFKVPPPG